MSPASKTTLEGNLLDFESERRLPLASLDFLEGGAAVMMAVRLPDSKAWRRVCGPSISARSEFATTGL